MSVYSDTTDAIVSRLTESERFGQIPIRADRQTDLASDLRKVAGKSIGHLILVNWNGSTRSDPNTYGPRVSDFSITVWAHQLLQKNDAPADDLIQLIEQLVDDHRPKMANGNPCHINARWRVIGVEPFETPEDNLLVHRIAVQIPVTLPTFES